MRKKGKSYYRNYALIRGAHPGSLKTMCKKHGIMKPRWWETERRVKNRLIAALKGSYE